MTGFKFIDDKILKKYNDKFYVVNEQVKHIVELEKIYQIKRQADEFQKLRKLFFNVLKKEI